MCQQKFLLFSILKWTWKVSNFASSTFKKLWMLPPPAKLAACFQSPARWRRLSSRLAFFLKTVPVRRNVSPAGKLSAGKDPGWALLQSRANSPRKPPGCFAPSKKSLALRSNVCTNQFPEELEMQASSRFQNWNRKCVQLDVLARQRRPFMI